MSSGTPIQNPPTPIRNTNLSCFRPVTPVFRHIPFKTPEIDYFTGYGVYVLRLQEAGGEECVGAYVEMEIEIWR